MHQNGHSPFSDFPPHLIGEKEERTTKEKSGGGGFSKEGSYGIGSNVHVGMMIVVVYHPMEEWQGVS